MLEIFECYCFLVILRNQLQKVVKVSYYCSDWKLFWLKMTIASLNHVFLICRHDGPWWYGSWWGPWWFYASRWAKGYGTWRPHRWEHAAKGRRLAVPQRVSSCLMSLLHKSDLTLSDLHPNDGHLVLQGLRQSELCLANGVQSVQSPKTRGLWTPSLCPSR